jgi:hypothetical protein
MAMHKSMIFIAAIAASSLVAGAGHAAQVRVKLTADQVKTTCGTKIIYTSADGFGCKVSCGDGKTCGFSCDKNGKNCGGVVQAKTQAAGSRLLQDGILGGSPVLGTQGPVQTGRPTGAPAAPAGGPVLR